MCEISGSVFYIPTTHENNYLSFSILVIRGHILRGGEREGGENNGVLLPKEGSSCLKLPNAPIAHLHSIQNTTKLCALRVL